jgi:hypothetical protein
VATDPPIIFTALAPQRGPALAQNSSTTDATEAALRSHPSIWSMSVHARMHVRAFLEMRMPRDSSTASNALACPATAASEMW